MPKPRLDQDEPARDAHQLALLEAAARYGVETRLLGSVSGEDIVEYTFAGCVARVIKGRSFPGLTRDAERLCDRKDRTKAKLAALGVRVPEGVSGACDDRAFHDLIAVFARRGVSMVAKPAWGSHGEGVRVGLRSASEVKTHLDDHARFPGERWIIEEQVGGKDLRMHVIAGEIVAACERLPASVVGDSERTIEQLMAARDRDVSAQNPRNRVLPAAETTRLLSARGLAYDSVPAAGERVPLREVANISEGASVRDITGELDEGWARVARAFYDETELPVFAIDARGEHAAVTTERAWVLEVNARPEWLHHTFPEAGGYDVAGRLLEAFLGVTVAAAALPRPG